MFSRNLILNFIAFAFAPLFLHGQDPAFSQFYANPLYLNPALAGAVECGRLNLNYRNKWPAFSNAFITYSISYDQTLPALNGGFGVLVMADQQGDAAYNRTTVAGYYSYNLMVSKKSLITFGIKGGYYQEKLNWEKLIFADQINPTTGQIRPTTSEPQPESLKISTADFGVGFIFVLEDLFFLGFSSDHIMRPTMSFYNDPNSRISMRITYHTGTMFNLSKSKFGNFSYNDFILQSSLVYQKQNHFSSLSKGIFLIKYPMTFGFWLRHNSQRFESATFQAGINWKNLHFSYSYDLSISKIGLKAGGAHEISFIWEICLRTLSSPTYSRKLVQVMP